MSTISVRGTDLYYEEAGNGTPLLLIHGTQPDATVWSNVRDSLAERAWVISYDRRGFSRSAATSAPDFRVHAQDAADLLSAIDATPAVVVGWSWGGLIALELAATHPDRVTSLVLIEPAVHLKNHPTLTLIRSLGKVQLLAKLGRKTAAVDTFFQWALSRSQQGSAFDDLSPQAIAIVHANASPILDEIASGTGEALTEEAIASITCPVTIVVGSLSDSAFQKAATRLQRLLPQSRITTIDGAGHAIHLDQPQKFVSILLAALPPNMSSTAPMTDLVAAP